MMRRIIPLMTLTVLLTGISSSLMNGVASAASGGCFFGPGTCSVSGDGDYGTNDVFTGRTDATYDVLHNVNSKTDFIDFINNRFGSTAHNKTGAQFIMARMMGTTNRPGSTSNWDDLMRQDSVKFNIVNNVKVYKTSWYDPGNNDDFFDNYSKDASGNAYRVRDVIDITQGGKIIARVEIACGNLVALQDATLQGWGNMQASSSVVAQAYVGQTVTWNHKVWDNDLISAAQSDTVSGDVKWTGGGWTTGPVPAGNGAVGGVVSPSQSYSNKFDPGDVVNRSYSFTIPAGAIPGQRYCQYIYGDTTSYIDPSNFDSKSSNACVLVVPPPKVTPGTCVAIGSVCSISSPSIGVGQQYTAKSTLSNSTGLAGSVNATARTWLDSGDPSCSAPGHPCTYNPLSDTIVGLIDGPRTVPVPAGSTVTFNTQGGTADATHAYVCTEIYNVTGQSGTIATASSSETCIPIVTRPYFSVLGGDVAAGAGFGTGGVGGANIIGTNNDGTPDYHGATAQLAALALGNIKSFATSQSQNGAVGPAWTNSLSTAYSPSALGFANSPLPAGTYGGGFNQPAWAVQNYYNDTPNGGVFPGFASAGTGNYYSPSGMTLNGATITSAAGGRKIVLKVNGDVYINGNIIYGATGSISDAPQFELIVSGNIYVDHSVTELDGFYDAQGNGGTTGKFVSCSDSTPQALYDTANIATCSNQLVVNGAVAAQKVILNRTYGDINGGGIPQAPGEIIRFSPLLWAPSAIGGSGTNGWQSVTSLPPIL